MKNCPKCGNSHEKSGKFCSRSCANSRTWSDEDKRLKSTSAKKSKKVLDANRLNGSSRKGGPDVVLTCKKCKNQFTVVYSLRNRKYCSQGCLDLDWPNVNAGSGGYRKGSGRGKSGWYKGYWCDSTWELAWVIYHLDNDISFDRNSEGFDYASTDGTVRKYYPDFIKDGVYHEIKGYKSAESEAKISQFPHQINVWYKKDMVPILEYVTKVYGNNYIELYEGNPHKQKLNECLVCGEPAINVYCSRSCSGVGNNRNSAINGPVE